MAAEYVASGGAGGRAVVARALQRPDEPAEILGYSLGNHGRNFPTPLKRGGADAVRRLYTERAAMRYDGLSHQLRMADVIELAHPSPRDDRQSALFRYLLDRRHQDDAVAGPALLPVLASAADLEAVPAPERRDVLRAGGPEVLSEAGFSWERLSGWLPGGMDAEAWEMAIPSIYTFNLAGYRPSALPAGERGPYTLGGFTDATFTAMSVLEGGRDADWPF